MGRAGRAHPEACEELRRRGLDPILFHARFAMCDRQRLEARVLQTFGRESTMDMRAGQILVATQVVEQSLDLDFDFMVSDLAPIDLLVQRAGRVWRRAREWRPLAGAQFAVLSPEPNAQAGADWFSGFLRRASYVYGDHALLWRSAEVLFGESVYGATGLDHVSFFID
jgi:CRISPR-associated endonuclease/helicase Cas3